MKQLEQSNTNRTKKRRELLDWAMIILSFTLGVGFSKYNFLVDYYWVGLVIGVLILFYRKFKYGRTNKK